MTIKSEDFELQLSHEKSKLVIETTHLNPVGSWLFDIESRKMKWSDKTFEILGLNPSDHEPDVADFIASFAEDQKEDIRLYIAEKLNEAATSSSVLVKYKTSVGKYLHLNVVFDVICDSQSKPIQLRGIVQDVTSWKTTEEAHIEINEKYRVLVDTASDVIYTINTEGIILTLNSTFEKLTGFKISDCIGKFFGDFIHPEDLKKALEIHYMVQSGIKPPIFELRFKFADGSFPYVEFSVCPMFKDEKVVGTLGIGREIQKRKQMEQELKEAKERLEIIFDYGPDAILLTRIQDGFYIDSNKTFTKYTGFSRDDLEGKSTLDIDIWHNPKDREKLLREVQSKGYCHNLEVVVKSKDGTLRAIDMSAEVITLKGVPHLLSISRDIALRKNVEKALKDSEERYRLLIEQAADGIFVGDKNGNFVEVNSKGCELAGYSREELLKMNISEFFSAEENKRVPLRYDLLQKGKTVHNERMLTCKDGSLIPVEMNTKRMPDGTYQAIIRNISDRRKAEEFLLKYQEELEKLVKKRTKELQRINTQLKKEISERQKSEELISHQLQEKEILLKEIHHRVKNNMQVIISLLNLHASTINDPQILDLYKESQNRIKSMALIHEKLYQSKDFSHIDFSDYLSSLAAYFSQIYHFENTTVEIVTKAHKIPFEFDTAITLGLIVNELVSNSMKYAFKDQPKGKITIELKKTAGKTITLLLSDNGCGLPKGINYKKTKSLGLQLVCTLTEQIDGTLTLNNKNGTHFKLVFPIKS